MTEEKRATVLIRSQVDRSIRLHLHETVNDDGGGRAFQGRALDNELIIRPGPNPGIDKKYFETWKEQNKGLELIALLLSEDEA